MKKIILYLLVSTSLCFSQDNFWEQTNGPYGVGAAPIAIDSNGNIYVGKDGILRSTDNGYSWITINNGLNNLDSHLITSITFNSNGYIFITTRDGIYRTTNNGEEWIRVTNGIPCYYSINCIKINSMGCIFAGTDDCGIYSSTDNGDNWVAVSNGIGQNTAVLSLLINSNDIIFSGTTKGALRSTDNGNSWIEINNGFNYADIYVQCLGINPSGDIIAATDQGIFRSTDNGDNWFGINDTLPSYPSYQYWCLAINSKGHIFVGSLGEGLIRSTDNGEHWIDVSAVKGYTPYPHDIVVEGLAINSQDQIFVGIMSHADGIYRSTDNGENWTKIGIARISINTLANNSAGYIFASGYGIYRSLDKGNTWTEIYNDYSTTSLVIDSIWGILRGSSGGIQFSKDNGDNWTNMLHSPSSSVLAINSNNYFFVGSSRGNGILRSTDSGNSWDELTDGLIYAYIDEMSGPYYPYANAIIFDSNNNVFVGTSGDSGIYKSTDNGDHWVLFSNGFTGNYTYAMIVIPNGYIFASTDSGVFRSIDDGENWSQVNMGLLQDRIFTFVLDKSGYIYAGTDSSGVLVSSDNGDTWSQLKSGLDEKSVYSLTIDQQDNIYAGTSSGVYKGSISSITPVELVSFDGSVINEGIKLEWYTATETNNKGFEIERSLNDKTNWQSIGFVEGNGTTTDKKSYSFTDKSISGGTYFYRLKQIDFDGSYHYSNVIEINFNAPLEFSISQNYPNPFNPSTEIKYSIKENSLVTLKIYDLLGSEIATIINEEKPAGNYNVTFDANNLAHNKQSLSSGIYFYTITAGNFHQTKKMVLLK